MLGQVEFRYKNPGHGLTTPDSRSSCMILLHGVQGVQSAVCIDSLTPGAGETRSQWGRPSRLPPARRAPSSPLKTQAKFSHGLEITERKVLRSCKILSPLALSVWGSQAVKH